MASIEQVKAALAQAAKQCNATTTLQSSSQAARQYISVLG